MPPGFAGTVNLTIPVTTVTGLADRPGELGGVGPIDPDLARDLASAAARNPRTTWCVTVTDPDGHAIGHGCARPEPASGHARRNGTNPARPAAMTRPAGPPTRSSRGSPSPPPGRTGHRAGTAPGG